MSSRSTRPTPFPGEKSSQQKGEERKKSFFFPAAIQNPPDRMVEIFHSASWANELRTRACTDRESGCVCLCVNFACPPSRDIVTFPLARLSTVDLEAIVCPCLVLPIPSQPTSNDRGPSNRIVTYGTYFPRFRTLFLARSLVLSYNYNSTALTSFGARSSHGLIGTPCRSAFLTFFPSASFC